MIEAVGRLDLQSFYTAYRADGHGRAAYEPSVMVALVLYAYSTDERSSRGIERRCRQDIAYRVITGNQVPDHATIARFIRRHQQSLNELFGAVLRLCARAGLVSSGVVAVDGTKLTASASSDANVDYDRIAREVIAEAIATDEVEDERHGEARGDELPPELQTEAGRRGWLERELAREQAERGDNDPLECGVGEAVEEFDPERIGRTGRRGWLREAHRQLEAERWQDPQPIPRSRAERLRLGARFLEDELDAECRGNKAYEDLREHRRLHDKRKLGGPTKPYTPPDVPAGEVNLTDPDSRRMKGNRRYIQGYNAQAVVNEQQIVLAAEITTNPTDWSQLGPMLETAMHELRQIGVTEHRLDRLLPFAVQLLAHVTREHAPHERVSAAVPARSFSLPFAAVWRDQHLTPVLGNDVVDVLLVPILRIGDNDLRRVGDTDLLKLVHRGLDHRSQL